MKKYTFFVFFLLLISTGSSFALTCNKLLSNKLTTNDIHAYLDSYLLKSIDHIELDGNNLPLFEINPETPNGTSFVLSMIYDVPYILQFNNNPNFWNNISTKQKKYFLRLVRRAFQKNKYQEHDDKKLMNLLFRKLGVDKSAVYSSKNELLNNQIQKIQDKYPLWIPKWVRVFFATRIAFKNPDSKFVLHKLYEEALRNAQESKGVFEGISPQIAFSLAHNEKNCAGICRHANEQMISTLIDLGVPPKDIKLNTGLFLLPFSGHAWTEVRINNRWKVSDATPAGFLPGVIADLFSMLNRAAYPFSLVLEEYRFYPFVTLSLDNSKSD